MDVQVGHPLAEDLSDVIVETISARMPRLDSSLP